VTDAPHNWLATACIADLRRALDEGGWTSARLTQAYLDRIEAIDRRGGLSAVIEVNPNALEIADALDREAIWRGPLHGLPILIKDNIDTGDQMQTSAGSLALVGQPAAKDAPVVTRLRAAGAVILGKTNLSEWANFRSNHSTSGWSSRGGQTRNPHRLSHSPSGSSSGSAAAVVAGLCAAALGTETDGSIICPSSSCGCVGFKPTLGLTESAGVIPIAHSQDTVGVHARSVEDVGLVLDAISVRPWRSAPMTRPVRVGVIRPLDDIAFTSAMDAHLTMCVARLRDSGAVVVDDIPLPSAPIQVQDDRSIVLHHEFAHDLDAYLATRSGVPVRSLAELVAFNQSHAATCLPHFGQDILQAALLNPFEPALYESALHMQRRFAREEGLDRLLMQHDVELLVCVSCSPAEVINYRRGDPEPYFAFTTHAAVAGYPHLTIPSGTIDGVPVGLSFVGRGGDDGLVAVQDVLR
jgi:amidase